MYLPNRGISYTEYFNDHSTDEGIKTALETVGTAAEATGVKLLNSSFSTMPDATNGTYVYKNKWEIIDQVVLSPGMLKAPGFRWKEGSSRPPLVMPEQLFDHDGDAIIRADLSRYVDFGSFVGGSGY